MTAGWVLSRHPSGTASRSASVSTFGSTAKPQSLNDTFPGNGRWTCGPNTSWFDPIEEQHLSADLDDGDILRTLASKWVLLVGDSSLRMLFHYIIGIIGLQWTHWPTSYNHHGPTTRRPNSCLGTPSWSSRYSCLEDVSLRGVRITYAFVDYGHEGQLQTIDLLANQSVGAPDAVLLGFGAWNIIFTPTKLAEYAVSVARFMAQLQEFFTTRQTGRYFATLRDHPIDWVFASVVGCPAEDGTFKAFNAISRAAAHAQGWSWFDRNAVIRGDCSPKATCAYGHHHPLGAAQNVILKLYLRHVARSLRASDA